MQDAGEAFWKFSLKLYDRPGISDLLIGLQDEQSVDVNLVLFLCWCGATGRIPFDEGQLSAAQDSIAVWQADVTAPLRQIRRRIKGGVSNLALEATDHFREDIKRLELASERIVQFVLAEIAPPVRGAGSAADVVALLQMYFVTLNLPDTPLVRASVERLAEACSLEA
ncbi:MAG: TIGR02444 family protein [Pseudomonadota bacterium]|nr:TIGR02444 family protein [Pseudomonadota bacterium]